jgi:UDP-N-acetylmuramoyl-tripeptide--D-alanyl-D-alanine ligase
MEPITLGEILEATGGTLLGGVQDLTLTVQSVDTDSRAMTPGALFVPLAGDRFDGHAYIGQALEQGAAGTLTGHELGDYSADKFYILVPDTMLALGDLAAWYRSRFDVKVVAVTGSVGKTTTKDMVASVLAERFSVLKTEGNFNNNIGVPKTLFGLTKEHQAAVIEMGMNHLGEIDYLTRMVRPDAAVITNIGDAHIENLGSRENTLRAKSEVFHGMTKKGLAILNGDDELLRTLKGKLKQKILWYGEDEGCEYRCVKLDDSADDHMDMDASTPQGEWQVRIPGFGRYLLYPVLSAAAVGAWLGMEPEEVAEGVLHFVSSKMRMDMIHCGDGVTVLNDTYNANPQSMRAAVEVLSGFSGAYKIAVLGDMLELGELGPALHESVGKFVVTCGIDCLIAVGTLAEHIYNGAVNAQTEETLDCYYRPTKEEAKAVLDQVIRKDATILCKASRGMAMEELVAYIQSIRPETQNNA